MPLYLLGISRSQDVPYMARQAATGHVGPLPFDPAETSPGTDGRTWWVRSGELAAAVAQPTDSRPEPVQHASALAAIHQRICVLPVRFGSVMPDEEAVRDLLRTRRRELLGRLDRLRGTCEMGLRIALADGPTPLSEPPPDAASPRTYLAQRRARYEREDRLELHSRTAVDRCVRTLDGLYRQWRKLTSSPPDLVRLAFLVEQQRLGLFRERLQMLTDASPRERRTLLGPWPPYSFV